MPKSAYPNGAKEQYFYLVQQAEAYLRRGKFSAVSSKQWRNRALDWLKQNSPNSDIHESLLVVPIHNLQRGLALFMKVRPIVPFLRENSAAMPPKPSNTRKIFIVHGHDSSLKNSVARFLTQLDLEPIILHEQPNRGRTIIEKFLEYSDVGFAVVLLTPDDRGGIAAAPSEKYDYRARQNVILELGFFLGRLGRERVAAIYDSKVEMPSDYAGVLFLPYDEGGAWHYSLAKELRAAGISIDMNKL